MLNEVLPFIISVISRVVNFIFELEINDEPRITLGIFLIACFMIGFILHLLLGTDFIPNVTRVSNSVVVKVKESRNSTPKIVPRHSSENTGKDFSTRVSRRKY